MAEGRGKARGSRDLIAVRGMWRKEDQLTAGKEEMRGEVKGKSGL